MGVNESKNYEQEAVEETTVQNPKLMANIFWTLNPRINMKHRNYINRIVLEHATMFIEKTDPEYSTAAEKFINTIKKVFRDKPLSRENFDKLFACTFHDDFHGDPIFYFIAMLHVPCDDLELSIKMLERYLHADTPDTALFTENISVEGILIFYDLCNVVDDLASRNLTALVKWMESKDIKVVVHTNGELGDFYGAVREFFGGKTIHEVREFVSEFTQYAKTC